MGTGSSKFASAGTLRGAHPPALPGVPLPEPLDATYEKTYVITCPMDKKGGDMFYTTIDGEPVGIQIPEEVPIPYTDKTQKVKPGDKFYYRYRHSNKVMASTLHALPGAITVESKPMIFSNCSYACLRFRINDQREQTSMSKMVGGLLQEAQEQLLQKTAEAGCNAVLGINTNVTIDSSGSEGNSKIVIVTMTGTPCNVVKSADDAPVVTAQAELIPEYY